MTASAVIIHDDFKLRRGQKLIDLSVDAFKLSLHGSASNAADTTVGNFASLTDEVVGNGYPAGGVALANVTWTPAGAIITFDSDDAQFLASGGSIVSRYAAIYDNTDASKTVLGHILLDITPADVIVTDGNTMTIIVNAAGWFTET